MRKQILCKMTKAASTLLLGCLLLLPVVFPKEVPGAGIAIEKPAAEEEDEEGASPCGDLDTKPGYEKEKES